MDPRTAARLAYQAYHAAIRYRGEPTPFEELDPTHQSAWALVAGAVVSYYDAGRPRHMPSQPYPTTHAEQQAQVPLGQFVQVDAEGGEMFQPRQGLYPEPQRYNYTCPNCGRVSYNFNDVLHQYCGHCHTFSDDQPQPLRPKHAPATAHPDYPENVNLP